MFKITIIDYMGKETEVSVSAEVFMIFEDSRKQDLRERNEMRRHRDYRGLQNYYVLQELASTKSDLEINVLDKDLFCRILEVVKICTPIQQERFYLYYIFGYTMREIAEKTTATIRVSDNRFIEFQKKSEISLNSTPPKCRVVTYIVEGVLFTILYLDN